MFGVEDGGWTMEAHALVYFYYYWFLSIHLSCHLHGLLPGIVI